MGVVIAWVVFDIKASDSFRRIWLKTKKAQHPFFFTESTKTKALPSGNAIGGTNKFATSASSDVEDLCSLPGDITSQKYAEQSRFSKPQPPNRKL